MKKLLRGLLALLLLSQQAYAQGSGQLPSGRLWGNSTASQALAAPTTVTAIIDRAISSTQGAVLTRQGAAWVGLAPGTAGLPLVSAGAAANVAYAILGLSGGGTAANLTASNGGLVYSTASALAILTATATAGQIPRSGSSAAPSWSTATYPATVGVSEILYGSSANVIGGLATANGGILNTGATGVPSITPTPVLGVAGTTVGSVGFENATSGRITLAPVAGALGTVTLTLPARTDTLVTLAGTEALTNKTINGNTITAGTFTLTGVAGKTLTFNKTITLEGTDGTTWTGASSSMTLTALNLTGQTITGGAVVTSLTQSTGNITVDCGARPLQFITNNGAWTITAPAADGSCMLLVTNGASAATPTFSGFTVGTSVGDALTNTNTSKFTLFVWRINSVSGYRVAAHQ